jgi:hypothetical protein
VHAATRTVTVVIASQPILLSESKSHVLANSPLRGVSAVPYSISDRVQPLRQSLLPRIQCLWFIRRIHVVLFLRAAIRCQPIEMGRCEDLCGLESGLSAWVWNARRSVLTAA